MSDQLPGSGTTYDDVYLIDGVRTGFGEVNGTLRDISATDLGIAVGRGVLARAEMPAEQVDMVIATNLSPSDFDSYYLPRHIGLYSGVRTEVPCIMVHRLCGSGFETLAQAADYIKLGKAETALCVGTESMSRNPIAAFTHRGGFALGQVDFRDFLWEALHDTCPDIAMGNTAENLAMKYQITRDEVDDYAYRSFGAALGATEDGFLAGEIEPLTSQSFEREGYKPRKLRLPRKVEQFAEDEHVKPTSRETLSKLRPVFGGVQTAANSSGIVDGAAAAVVSKGTNGHAPLARIVATASVGVPPEIMGIGPAPAIRKVLELAGLRLDDVDRFDINEAFGAQYLAVEKELGLDRDKANVNGGAIALGHPLAATGLRCTMTVSRELKRRGLKYGIGSACCGGGQGVAVLVENPEAA